MRRVLLVTCVVLGTIGGAVAEAGPQDVANDVAEEIMSPYCPGVTLHDCPSRAARDLRERIAGWASDGWTKEEILVHLEEDFGPTILGQVSGSGPGLLAWLLPALAMLGGLAVAARLARRWTKAATVPPLPVPPAARARLDAELERVRSES